MSALRGILSYAAAFGLLTGSPFISRSHMSGTPPTCPYTATDTSTLENVDGSGLRIAAGAGKLHIRGTNDRNIHIRAERCASTPAILSKLAMDVRRDGRDVIVSIRVPRELFSSSEGSVATADLWIEVPRSVDVQADGSSGDVQVADVRSLKLNSSLGDVRVEDVAGEVDVRAGPGSIVVSGCRGPVSIDQGVGAITIRNVESDVHVAKNHTGPIELRDVRGKITIAMQGPVRARSTE